MPQRARFGPKRGGRFGVHGHDSTLETHSAVRLVRPRGAAIRSGRLPRARRRRAMVRATRPRRWRKRDAGFGPLLTRGGDFRAARLHHVPHEVRMVPGCRRQGWSDSLVPMPLTTTAGLRPILSPSATRAAPEVDPPNADPPQGLLASPRSRERDSRLAPCAAVAWDSRRRHLRRGDDRRRRDGRVKLSARNGVPSYLCGVETRPRGRVNVGWRERHRASNHGGRATGRARVDANSR
jgi:hypothetical protein